MNRLNKWLLFLFAAFLFACEKDIVEIKKELPQESAEPTVSLKEKVLDVMQEWYLWNNELPEVNIDDYESPHDLLEALKKKPADKWSYIEKEEDYDNYFEKGQYEGYGFRMVFDDKDQLKVAFVYEDSPFFRAGIARAWTISKINGTSVQSLVDAGTFGKAFDNTSNTFEFIDPQGNTVTKSISKSTIGINSVLYKNVYDIDGVKVGYLVFNNFLNTSLPELQDAFSYFKQEGIRELILDLRYNGGGRVSMAEYIASNVIGNRGNGHDFIQYIFNQDKLDNNEAVQFETPEHPLELNRLITITSGNTASASELVINGLKPFMDVVLIGNDTYGKPVGSFPIRHDGYAISPISFKIANENGEGEYFDGLKANAYIEDDLAHDFGSSEEARLKEALYFIRNGAFSGPNARIKPAEKVRKIQLSGFRQEIGAF